MTPGYLIAAHRAATSLAAEGDPLPAFLLLGPPDDPSLLVVARTEADRDGADHLSELATLVAAGRPPMAALAIPGIFRDLRSDETFARSLILTAGWLEQGAPRLEVLSTLWVEDDDGGATLGAQTSVEPVLSPVASLLCDALTLVTRLDPVGVMGTLAAWGHLVCLHRGIDAPQALPAPTAKVRHDVHRLAVELTRRHRPTWPSDSGFTRPSVPVDLPPGFVPACPI